MEFQNAKIKVFNITKRKSSTFENPKTAFIIMKRFKPQFK